MRAIILDAPGQFRTASLPDTPAPEADEVLVRVQRVGVCGTDYHAYRGEQPFFTYPRILGHEVSAEVLAVGAEVAHIAVGDRCAVRPYFEDGTCPACQRGKPNCCMNIRVFGVHIDGGMRETALLPATHLHPATTLSFDQLALVEPLAIGAHAVARAQIMTGERVLVVGAGPIGLAVTQFAVLAGAEVLVMDISEQRLAFCQRLWPTVTCLDAQGDALATLTAVVGADELPTAVFDATGSRAAMQTAFSYVGYGGRVIFVGLFQGEVAFHDPLFHSREVTLFASRNALGEDFTRIIAAMEANQLDIAPWITHRATLAEVAEVFPQWLDPGSGIIKGLITV